MIKCPNCGRENDDSFTFCLDCGNELRPKDGVPANPAAPTTGTARAATSPSVAAVPSRQPASTTPAPTSSAASTPAQPAASTPAQPAASTPAQPAASTPAQPAASTPAQPAASTPAQPAASTPAQPAASTPAQPAAPKDAPAPAEQAGKCPKCGVAITSDSAFCSSCGHRIGEDAARGQTMFMHQVAPDAEEKQRARLVLIKPDGTEGTVFTLAAERTTIGRSQGIIMFPKDPYISPKHADIGFKDGKLSVTDLGSLNGVYFRMSGEEQIAPGTYFRIGRQLLRLEVPGEFQAMDIKTPAGDDSKYWGSPPPQVWARLVQVLEGGKIGEIHLLTQPEVLMGREEGEVRFPEDGFISSRHCMLVNKQGDCFIRDLGSSNGTYLRIRDGRPLVNEDRIQIGNQVLKVDLS